MYQHDFLGHRKARHGHDEDLLPKGLSDGLENSRGPHVGPLLRQPPSRPDLCPVGPHANVQVMEEVGRDDPAHLAQ